jgi:ABC-2 type transport system ATP-binding protein
MAILEVKNLTKKFKDFVAVNGISFSLDEGEILGLLGQNGAGKTTTMQMLLGVLTPTTGAIHYFGKNLNHHRSEVLENVNFSSTYTNLPWWLTVKENLTWMSYMYDIKDRKKRIDKIVEAFRLEDIYSQSMTELSAGQVTRVNLAKAFLNYPKILLLDEPTASLDVEIAKYIHEFLLREREKFQVSIIITSHNMAEVEELCDRVIVINKGEIVANDTPYTLSRLIKTSHIELVVEGEKEKLIAYLNNEKISFTNTKKVYSLEVATDKVASTLQAITKLGILYDELSIEKPTLEDYFLDTVKGGNA